MRYVTLAHGCSAREKPLAMVNEVVAAEAMQEPDARVDLDEKTAEDVAGEYLSDPGMVP